MNELPDTEHVISQQMEEDGLAIRILLPAAKIEHFIVSKKAVPPLRRIAVIDTECTGTDPASDQIFDLAYVILVVDADGDIIDVEAVRSGLCDPLMPIPARITKLTGITDDDVAGKTIDLDLIEADFARVDVFVAHNAPFDLSFIRHLIPTVNSAAWACTLNDFDWLEQADLDGRSLGHLLMQVGFYNDAHRALADVVSLIHLLAYPLADGRPVMAALLANAAKQTYRIAAIGASFGVRVRLKARGYRWNPRAKTWWTEVAQEQLDDEVAWIRREITPFGPPPQVEAITWRERHR